MSQDQITARIPWRIAQDGEWWVGHSPLLKITVQGKSKDQLIERIHNRQRLLLLELAKTGEIETFLFVHGFEPSDAISDSDDNSAYVKLSVDFPVMTKEVDAKDLAATSC